jgi:tRNA 2-thiouridine synthesizing protein A
MLATHPDILAVTVAQTLDARDMPCPLPLLKAKLALRELASGERLRVVATDAGSWRDIPAYARLSGQILLGASVLDDEYLFLLEKA